MIVLKSFISDAKWYRYELAHYERKNLDPILSFIKIKNEIETLNILREKLQ